MRRVAVSNLSERVVVGSIGGKSNDEFTGVAGVEVVLVLLEDDGEIMARLEDNSGLGVGSTAARSSRESAVRGR